MSDLVSKPKTEISTPNKVTFSQDDLHAWLGNITSENTRKVYYKAVADFHAWIDVPLENVKRIHCVDYRNHLSRSYSNASVNQKLSAIRNFYDYLIESGVINVNPAKNVKGLKVSKFGKSDALNVKENQHIELLESIDTSNVIGKRDYAIILLLMTTGLRVSAVASATITDLKRESNGVYLHFINKGGSEERKLITDNTLQAIVEYLETREVSEDSPLFATMAKNNPAYVYGKPMSRFAITKVVSNRAKVIGLEGITAHNLRHTTAMVLDKNDVPLEQIQKQLNHKDRMTTLIYLDHLTDESDTIASEILGNEFSNISRKKDKKE